MHLGTWYCTRQCRYSQRHYDLFNRQFANRNSIRSEVETKWHNIEFTHNQQQQQQQQQQLLLCSQYFGDSLLPFVPSLTKSDASVPYKEQLKTLAPELCGAMITSHGELTPPFKYLFIVVVVAIFTHSLTHPLTQIYCRVSTSQRA
jgi:hypothetical protein